MSRSGLFCLPNYRQFHDLPYSPHMLPDTTFDRQSNPKRLTHASEMVVHVKQGNHRDIVFQSPGER
jgi:hypothetical protein